MLVRERMSSHPVTILPDTPITEALRLLREKNVRHVPVVDAEGGLVGIVSEKDLLYASPSPATSMSIYELHYMLSHLPVSEVMTKDVITVSPETPIEEAARIMSDRKIGGLPVVEGEQLVGIITETDVFAVLLEMLGARQRGLRLTLQIPERKGEIARITTAIAQRGGNLLALGTFWGDDPTTAIVTVKVEDLPRETLLQAMDELHLGILDVREM